jgi:biopolymer transport protein ExbD
MSFLPEHADDDVMSEINMTPLIDVMLVLLIVFILAVPANSPPSPCAWTSTHKAAPTGTAKL